ncbi:MAG: hypothetical protein DWI10_06365 [Planctomycetota bacterium]|nr:MAG: hypothetical protein DWI10_06365 [Planctomycetota bacterium]
MRVNLYDAAWRLLESRIDSNYNPAEPAPTFDEHTQHVWGLRYIDDIISTRRDLNPGAHDGAEITMFHATDAQFSSVAVLLDNGDLLERVAYTAYGVARHQWLADANGDGAVNSADMSIVLSAYGPITSASYRSEADFNRDGIINSADLSPVLAFQPTLPEGTLSATSVGNRTGYCGYRFAPETETYLARNRWYEPKLGRWIERDPLEYVDGMNLYEYVRSRPIDGLDPTGLDDWWRDPLFDFPKALESSPDCFVTLWIDPQEFGHHWIEFVNPSGSVTAVGFWPSGWMTPNPSIPAFRRGVHASGVVPTEDPYYRYRVRGDRTMLPQGAVATRLIRKTRGFIGFGVGVSTPCARASCEMIRDCLRSFEPVRPWSKMTNNCRMGAADAYMSCCLERLRGVR